MIRTVAGVETIVQISPSGSNVDSSPGPAPGISVGGPKTTGADAVTEDMAETLAEAGGDDFVAEAEAGASGTPAGTMPRVVLVSLNHNAHPGKVSNQMMSRLIEPLVKCALVERAKKIDPTIRLLEDRENPPAAVIITDAGVTDGVGQMVWGAVLS